MHLQSECIEKYQFELCSTYDNHRKYDMTDMTLISRTLLQVEVDMSQAYK